MSQASPHRLSLGEILEVFWRLSQNEILRLGTIREVLIWGVEHEKRIIPDSVHNQLIRSCT